MEDALREVEKAHLKSLTTAFVVLEAVALFCLVTLLIVGLRSLLYVFARVTFGRDAQAYVTLRDDESDATFAVAADQVLDDGAATTPIPLPTAEATPTPVERPSVPVK